MVAEPIITVVCLFVSNLFGCSGEGNGTPLQYFCLENPMDGIGKDSDTGKDWGQEEKGMTEDEMAEWHHRLDGREFE